MQICQFYRYFVSLFWTYLFGQFIWTRLNFYKERIQSGKSQMGVSIIFSDRMLRDRTSCEIFFFASRLFIDEIICLREHAA